MHKNKKQKAEDVETDSLSSGQEKIYSLCTNKNIKKIFVNVFVYNFI